MKLIEPLNLVVGVVALLVAVVALWLSFVAYTADRNEFEAVSSKKLELFIADIPANINDIELLIALPPDGTHLIASWPVIFTTMGASDLEEVLIQFIYPDKI